MEAIKNLQKITLAFINDKSPILDLICNELIVSGIEVLFQSESIKEGLSQLCTLKTLPSVCIIDLDFYNKNVLVELQELRIKYPSIKLIAHSDIDNEKVGEALLDIGIVPYIQIGGKII